MKQLEQYISRNWLWIIVDLVLTVISVRLAYAERGYVAYGGEYLTLPLVLMEVEVVQKVVSEARYLLGMEDDNGLD